MKLLTAACILGILFIAAGSARSEAQCIEVTSGCFCAEMSRVGVVVTEAIDGGSATVRVESGKLGLVGDAGSLSLAQGPGEMVGARWLVLGDERRPVDAQGLVGCPYVEKRLPVSDVVSAVGSPSCGDDLGALGLTQPPCRDVVRCAVSPLLLMPLLALSLILRRRR